MPTNPGYNQTRRNRNIGTSKQGHGQSNKLVIPWPGSVMKSFYERLSKYSKTVRAIDGKEYVFVVEETRENSGHACSISDFVRILEHVPAEDLDGLNLFVFRQPKRKEQILSSVWGRLIYSYEFEKQTGPAIIIEATDLDKTLKWSKHIDADSQRELDRLIEDGHAFRDTGRYHETKYKLEAVRNTQLYRTLPHDAVFGRKFFAAVKFQTCSFRFGVDWNEDNVHVHKFAERGLEAYRAHEIVNSRWILELKEVDARFEPYNLIHSRNDEVKHYLLPSTTIISNVLPMDIRSKFSKIGHFAMS